MPCSTCTDEARCDRLGLCQDVAKQQLPEPEPEPEPRQLSGYPALSDAEAVLEHIGQRAGRRRAAVNPPTVDVDVDAPLIVADVPAGNDFNVPASDLCHRNVAGAAVFGSGLVAMWHARPPRDGLTV